MLALLKRHGRRDDRDGVDIASNNMRRWLKELGRLGADARRFACTLGERSESSSRLFIVGTPEFEPWHFTAHLDEQARLYRRRDLTPTLLRWRIPEDAPQHLSFRVDDMARADRDQTYLVITPYGDAPDLLERVADAKHRGARIMTLHRGMDELEDLSHETLLVDETHHHHHFDVTQHVVTDMAPASEDQRAPWWSRVLVAR